MRALIAILMALFLFGTDRDSFAQAPPRTFPAGSKVGTLVMGNFPEATINDKSVRFAPGARILGLSNTTQIPSSLSDPVKIRFRIDAQGEVDIAWILTADEIAAASAASK